MRLRLRSKFWIYVRRLTQPFASAWVVFAADLTKPRPTAPPIADFHVRLYQGAEDLQASLECLVSTGLTPSDVSFRMNRGDMVSVGFFRNLPVAHTWACFGEMRATELGLKIPARTGQLIQYDTLVLKDFRRHGYQFAVAAPVLDYAERSGYTRTIAWVNALNRPSCKNQRKWGKSVAMVVFVLRVPGMRRRFVFSLGAPIASVFAELSTSPALAPAESSVPNR